MSTSTTVAARARSTGTTPRGTVTLTYTPARLTPRAYTRPLVSSTYTPSV